MMYRCQGARHEVSSNSVTRTARPEAPKGLLYVGCNAQSINKCECCYSTTTKAFDRKVRPYEGLRSWDREEERRDHTRSRRQRLLDCKRSQVWLYMTQNYSLYRGEEQSNQSKSQHVKTVGKGNRNAPYLTKNKGDAKRGYVLTGNKGITRNKTE